MTGVGIIGCGRIAQERHLPEYQENPDARIVGVYDVNGDRAREIAEKYGAKAFDSYEELLKAPDIEAVSVCSSNNTHAEITIAALNAGKHVLCEKPMAVTYEQCKAMTEAAEANGKYLMIDQNQRLTKAHIRAKSMIEEGVIGRVVTFRTTFGHGGPETWSIDPGKNTWFFDRKRAAMGAMADLGIHKTDLIQFLLSQTVTETTARLMTLDKRDATGNLAGVDDNAICIYKMSGGTVGTMTASWTYYGAEDNSTILYGTEGIMRIYDDPAHALVIVAKDGTRSEYDIEAIQTNDNQTKSGVIDLFIDSLENKTEPAISGKSVLSAMRAVFASIESSEKGCTVRIQDETSK
ncbi:MAG TPA: Gfo/Idh/MocA family oxidoreductase [Candidatus Mediterraneibacter merdipullorum]|nr:Gfo/Idh/MocA family oxidoreductase [Candidatus Mediterraneibacter merdipullorum]